jgi:hypothetical protein
MGKIEGFPDPPEAENAFKRIGRKGGNRTLDPGIMSRPIGLMKPVNSIT